jgi:hypothetical protein
MAFETLTSLMTKKVVALTATGAVAVAGATGGLIWYVNQPPELEVRQRSASASVPGKSEWGTTASCESHETLLSGGFATDGAAFAVRSKKYGDSSWLVTAYNPVDEPANVTAYAVCVNADIDVVLGDAQPRTAFVVRNSGLTTDDLADIGPFAEAGATNPITSPACPQFTVAVGAQFEPGRTVAGRYVAPVPMAALTNLGALAPNSETFLQAALNPGTQVSHANADPPSPEPWRYPRIVEPQPLQANFKQTVRPVCASLYDVTVETATVAVPAGGGAGTTARCSAGRKPVGGGFSFPGFPDGATREKGTSFLDDGFVFAPVNAPARGEPSGSIVHAWYVNGLNYQQPDTYLTSALWSDRSRGRETVTGMYFDRVRHHPNDDTFAAFGVPPSRDLVASVVCAKITAEPKAPPASLTTPPPPVLGGRELPPAIEISPTDPVTPIVRPSATPSATPTTTTPAPPVTTTTTKPPPPVTTTTTQPPLPPSVVVNQPGSGGTVCVNPTNNSPDGTPFSVTALRKPGNQPITASGRTSWKLTHPQLPPS